MDILSDHLKDQVVVRDALELKEEGNKHFNSGSYVEALNYYSKGIKITKEDDSNKAILYKNRAATYLKLKEYNNALNDCDAALRINPADPKALFRRCQALEELERYDEAYKDAKQMFQLDPKNSAVQPMLARLHKKIQELADIHSSTSNRIDQMFDFVFGNNPDKEKKVQAINNLLVLAREKSGADIMYKRGVLRKILGLLKSEKNHEIITACIRIIGELCKDNISRTKEILRVLSIPLIIEGLNSNIESQVNAAQHSIQTILNTLGGMDKKECKNADKILLKENEIELNAIMKMVVHNVSSRSMSALGRESLLEIIMKNSDYNSLHWGEKILDTDGIQRILEVASELKEFKYESSIPITDNTRNITAATIEHIYNSLSADIFRDKFRSKIDEFVKDKLKGMDIEPKVRVVTAITVLLLGALDVGNYCIAQQGIIEMMLVMAGTDDVLQQRVAAEALIAASTKKDKCKSIISQGVGILKKLYHSKDDAIRVRALVGLCKLGSSGGNDASIRPFADGSAQKLALACRKFLINPSKDHDLRKWAAEGLSYLTLDAEIKEELIEDKTSIQALIELAKVGDLSVVYGVITTFVNLTNCYQKEEIIPELIELAKFAKQHVPEEHELDGEDFVKKRIHLLTEMGITNALVALSKTDSNNCKELICRVFNAICENQELRGTVVQQGGAKALIPMALEGTAQGKHLAAQALSRISITINPEVAFPGQRSAEVVRPILQLLHPDCNGLQNFEALMALCNLARVSPSVRARMTKDGGINQIEHYSYEDHVMLKRASVQCLVNLIISEKYMQLLEGNNDRVKYWTLLCMDEDFETSKAAAGGLAMMTEYSKKCCKKVFEATQWLDSIRYLLANENSDMRYRGVYIVNNMMSSCKSVAEKIIETDIMELLMALSKLPLEDPESVKTRDLAEASLKKAEEWKLIKPADENIDNDDDLE